MSTKKYKLYDGWICCWSEYDTLLEAMSDLRVFSISLNDDGRFEIKEGCDNFFGADLTKQELIDLGNELIKLANSAK